MFYNKILIFAKTVFSVLFFLCSGIIFMSVIFDSTILSNGGSLQSIENISAYIPFFSTIQSSVQYFQMFVGPAIHAIYIVLFIWAIALWDTRHSFSIICV
jgi:hypothetical protein